MPKYFVRGIDRESKEFDCVVEASHEEALLEQFQKEGSYILSIKKKPSFSLALLREKFFVQKKIFLTASRKSIFLFTRQLSLLLNAELPLVRCLKILREQKNSFLKSEIIEGLEKDLLSGKKFSDALKVFPFVFKSFYVSMVYSGEMSGQMNVVLEHLSEFFERTYLIRKRFLNSLFYPAIIFFSVVFVISILLFFVIPKFQVIFSDLNIPLPYPTRILLTVSACVKKYFFLVFVLGIVLIVLASFFLSFRKIKIVFDRILLKLPFWGDLYQKLELLKFTRLIGILLKNGVPILDSFEISKSVVKSHIFFKFLNCVQSDVREGISLAEAFQKHFIFPTMFVNMIDIGEETGRLDQMFLKTAAFYEEDVKNIFDIIVKLIEPLLILFLAGIVSFIVISMFLPMVTMLSAIGR